MMKGGTVKGEASMKRVISKCVRKLRISFKLWILNRRTMRLTKKLGKVT